MTYAYLGPEGTFTQAALRLLVPAGTDARERPYPSVPAALDAARLGDCEAAVVPLENSVRGVVPATMDQLVSAGLHINAEVEVAVAFALMAPDGVAVDDITVVHSHPHALAQCEQWLAARLPGVRAQPAASTAAAAQEVSRAGACGAAAIAAPQAAGRYGLRTLATGLGRDAGAVTRFVSVSPRWARSARSEHERTSLLVSPGAAGTAPLVDVLKAFEGQGVDLSWIQSWPTGERLGSYHMFLDVDAHIEDRSLLEAMTEVAATGVNLRFLGSYPRWREAS